ncbi:hypothetical protein [Pedobacter antarcticus]|uniref:hypothetical protein n=1 Tax=Pedobacter antarcticus TaxID=34086 RepID=UPI001C56CF74|nr:hypothetical protein [Pedobacter antarcticus]
MKTLITGGKSAQALKVSKAFAADNLILADYGSIPAFTSAKYQLISLGERNDTVIAHNLLTHCLDLQVECLVPLYDFESDPLLRSALLFEEFNIKIFLPERTVSGEYMKPDGVVLAIAWAVFNESQLVYSSDPELNSRLEVLGLERGLNGVFQLENQEGNLVPYLLQIG